MFSRMVLACRLILVRSFVASLALILMSASAAHAQCSGGAPLGTLAPTVAMAVAGVSASVGALVTSINSANTAFLGQSNAFIGSPANPQPDQEGGGVWARGVGGHLSTTTPSTTENISFGGPTGSEISCNTRTHEDFAGVQIGTDFARLNVDGWNLHVGSTIGYLGANTQDATLPGLNPGPPTFHDSLEIPFVGVYAAASYGGFLVDGQIRGNFFQNDVSDPNHGLSGQQFNASGISLTGNVAYNQNLGNQWFIEPSAGIIWSRTNVDPLNVPGTYVLASGAGPSGVLIPPWLLTVNDIESTLGRLSVRVGTTVTTGDVLWQPFASASVFHEFEGGATASLTTNFSAVSIPYPTLSSTVLTSGLGTYGQFGLGIAGQVMNTGWLSYVRVDYRTGDNIEGWSANGGLRYQFVPDPTDSRWVPLKAVPAAYDWSGFYVGGYAGAEWGFSNWNFAGSGTTDPGFAGFLGGGEIGYNYQIGKWVFGVEEGAGWTNAHGARPCPYASATPPSANFFYNCEIDENWLATTTARIGYAYWDRLLTYVKGGAAIAQDQARFVCDTNSQTTASGVSLVGCPSETDTKIKVGGTVGVGTEFGLTKNVSVKGEFMYFDLGTDHRNLDVIDADVQRSGFLSTIGLNFRFGG
jgi:opacity protein-like surface antigen